MRCGLFRCVAAQVQVVAAGNGLRAVGKPEAVIAGERFLKRLGGFLPLRIPGQRRAVVAEREGRFRMDAEDFFTDGYGFLMVQEGKADAIITAINTAQLYLDANPNCGMSIVPDFRFVEDESTKGTRIGVAKGETELIEEVNRIIGEVREEGLYDQWYEQYTEYARSLGIQ